MARSSGIEPRRAALKVLEEVRGGKPFDSALQEGIGALPDADRRLAHELAAGVLRQRTVLDQQLAPLIPRGWGSVSATLQDILRLGAYQLTTLERVPSHAAVDTSVALAKSTGGARAGGFVNAVLRRLTRGEPSISSSTDAPAALAQHYSHPEWLVRRWIDAFGPDQTEQLLQWNNTRPRLVLQPARQDAAALAERWRASGIQVEPAPYEAGLLTDRSRPTDLPGYSEGDFIVQDPAHALLVRYARFPSTATVYDACAAPGGKTIAFGRTAPSVLAGEISRIRARRLAENVARAGSGREHVIVADAKQPPLRAVGAVLLDAPCSGTGTFARHPDGRWRVSPQALAALQRVQRELLGAMAPLVETGGLLLYSTCSLESEENQAQVEEFLDRHPEFVREPAAGVPESLLSEQGDLLILPQRHGMDGAYAARMRRVA
jgi:16S rRNA (cytosine967-C5)-methyltransferase